MTDTVFPSPSLQNQEKFGASFSPEARREGILKNNFSVGKAEALLQFLGCVSACANCKCAYAVCRYFCMLTVVRCLVVNIFRPLCRLWI